jgi:hypothetical protein
MLCTIPCYKQIPFERNKLSVQLLKDIKETVHLNFNVNDFQ